VWKNSKLNAPNGWEKKKKLVGTGNPENSVKVADNVLVTLVQTVRP